MGNVARGQTALARTLYVYTCILYTCILYIVQYTLYTMYVYTAGKGTDSQVPQPTCYMAVGEPDQGTDSPYIHYTLQTSLNTSYILYTYTLYSCICILISSIRILCILYFESTVTTAVNVLEWCSYTL